MNKIKLLSIFSVIILIFVIFLGFTHQYVFSRNEFTDEIKSTFKNFLYQYDNFDDELPVLFSDDCNDPKNKLSRILKDEALEDVDYLFSLLKYGYSGYEYFGGDEKFNSAKANMLWSITELNGETICPKELLDIIYSELGFIQDSHFTIGNYKLCKFTKYFSSRKYAFFGDANGFYTTIDDEIFYLTEVNNSHPFNYLKLTLDEEGNTAYNLGNLSDSDEIFISLDITLESRERIRNEKISLFEYIPIYREKDNSYNYYEIDNIPILEVNSLCKVAPDDNTLEDFINDSSKLRDKDTIIIDLRNNKGGSLINVEEWYKGFTGAKLRKDMVHTGLYTNTSLALAKHKFEMKENETEKTKCECIETILGYENEEFFPGWSSIEYEDFEPVENNVNVYILVDKNTSSASEFLAYYLKKLDNVIIVGTNTNGCLLTGNCNSAYLPHSNIPLYISHVIYMTKDFDDIEGMGLLPDLWIKPDQSLDRLIKYINKNK